MKNIKLLSLLALLVVGAVFLSNCGPGEDDPVAPTPVVEFISTDSTFISSDQTLAANTPIKMGINAIHDSKIKSIKVILSLDGQTDQELMDTEQNDKEVLNFIYEGETQATEGTEIYTFIVADKDGNSTSKSITITNIGDPGKDLLYIQAANDGSPIKVYNFTAPTGFLGAYELQGGPLSSTDDDGRKDIQDLTETGESWPARWGSRNGSVYKKISGDEWNTVENDATIQKAWDNGGAVMSSINLEEAGVYLINIKDGGRLAMLLITELNSNIPKQEFATFEYKIQDL